MLHRRNLQTSHSITLDHWQIPYSLRVRPTLQAERRHRPDQVLDSGIEQEAFSAVLNCSTWLAASEC
jgi:hypothetical protein